MREGGLEPPHPYGHSDLNAARLPIPPLARDWVEVSSCFGECGLDSGVEMKAPRAFAKIGVSFSAWEFETLNNA